MLGPNDVLGITASVGQPYHGRLVNGVPFPNQFQGYTLRDQERSYTTPEVVGAVLDAVERVREQHPGTCDLFVGDFSVQGGGWLNHHRSHQNGRDVDLGMYLKGNRAADTFVSMNEDNLDVPKTWCLVEGLLRSQRVQYIFLDRRIQRLLHDYAASRGADSAYLERIFGGGFGRSVINHVANHHDHIHVRFYTPWSTLAAHVAGMDEQKRTVIEMAQQAFLPKKVNYYVKGNEKSLESLARSFGVQYRDLCRWNQLSGNSPISPGSCLVFYKRGFELEPVHLAQALSPNFEAPGVHLAALRPVRPETPTPPPDSVSDAVEEAPAAVVRHVPREKRVEPPSTASYTVQRGDTPASIARKNKMELRALLQMNGFKKVPQLKPGQKLKVTAGRSSGSVTAASSTSSGFGRHDISTRQTVMTDASRGKGTTTVTYTSVKGDTLAKISRKSGIPLDALCQLNAMKRNAPLKPGQKIRLAQGATMSKGMGPTSEPGRMSDRGPKAVSKSPDKKAAVGKADPKKNLSKVKAVPAKPVAEPKNGASKKVAVQGKDAPQGKKAAATKGVNPAKNGAQASGKSVGKTAPESKAASSATAAKTSASPNAKSKAGSSSKEKVSASVKKPAPAAPGNAKGNTVTTAKTSKQVATRR
ncbi:MAG TPA: penicillin-insensitive murein endopeptidase [Syntrophobacteraceae bacterium]|nr:penicillin-insensitive murein endopeptidase [Syntrophobacteraceae bacterium]